MAKGKPLDPIIDFITTNETISQARADRVQGAIDEVTDIAATAQADLGVQLAVFASEAQAIMDSAYEPGEVMNDMTRIKAAGLEIVSICESLGY